LEKYGLALDLSMKVVLIPCINIFYRWIFAIIDNEFIKKISTRCNNVSKFYYSMFIWNSTCCRRHIAHHQEPKTALIASGFSYVEGCWMCSWWTLSGTPCLTSCLSNYLPHMQNQSCQCNFRLLMMGRVSPETCSASCKYGIIKFGILLHLVGFFFMNFLYELWCTDPQTSNW
jgi:hypothetical protein